MIDSGIDYNHLDLAANMFRNTADCNNNGIDDDGNGFVDDCFGIDTANNDSDPLDDNNHGTHVAGSLGAVGNNSAGVAGINWNIKIMACKFVNASGSGTIADAIDCLDYVKTMKDRGLNIIATSNSWGGGGFSQALLEAIEPTVNGECSSLRQRETAIFSGLAKTTIPPRSILVIIIFPTLSVSALQHGPTSLDVFQLRKANRAR